MILIPAAWRCDQGPQLNNAFQIDAGQGKVVARDRNYYVYFLIGSTWYKMTQLRFRHVTVGPAGLWATNTANRVYKYVAGHFRFASGKYCYHYICYYYLFVCLFC